MSNQNDTPGLLEMFVPGTPVTEGSTRGFKHATTGKVIVTHNKRAQLNHWRTLIATQAQIQRLVPVQGCRWPKPQAVHVNVVFLLPRPKRPQSELPITKPDTDKLLRAVGDALTQARIIEDDSQIVTFHGLKVYASQPTDVGAWIQVGPFDDSFGPILTQSVVTRINKSRDRNNG